MPNCDFYALAEDLVRVLDFIFEQPGWTLIELASVPGHKLRQFHQTQEIVDGFPGFMQLTRSQHFQLHSPEMGAKWKAERINFNPGVAGKFRYDCEGWGLIQLYFGQLRKGHLSNCHTNHNSPSRAQKWEPTVPGLGAAGDWDFAAVNRMSSRLNRFIRKLAVGKQGSRPILPAAEEAARRGVVLS